MQTLKELKAEASKIGAKISKIEHESRTETNRQHVGRYFKYRNCYSCPEKPSDYWWLYIRVTGLDRDGSLQYTECQIDKYGEITIKAKKHMYWLTDGYIPISAAEFGRAWDRVAAKLNAIDPR